MSEILGPTGKPVPEPDQEKVDLLDDDLMKMGKHFVDSMTEVGLECILIINGVLDKRLRRVYLTNVQKKADRLHYFDTLAAVERSEGIHMPAHNPLVKL